MMPPQTLPPISVDWQVTPDGHSALVAHSWPLPVPEGHVALQLEEPLMLPPARALARSNETQQTSPPEHWAASPHTSASPMHAAADVHFSPPAAASPFMFVDTQQTSEPLQSTPPHVSPPPGETVPPEDELAEDPPPDEEPETPELLEPPELPLAGATADPSSWSSTPPLGRGRTWPPQAMTVARERAESSLRSCMGFLQCGSGRDGDEWITRGAGRRRM
jgi:hypothetical protein